MSGELQRYFSLIEERPEQFRSSELICIEKDVDKIMEYEKKTGKKIGVVYQSDYNFFVVDLIRDSDGTYYTYERLLPVIKQGAVVAMTKCGNQFVILRQYRHAIQGFQYAFPRGFGETGITAEENVKKEVKEELNAVVKKMEYLGKVIADSGLCGNEVSVFLCEVEGFAERYGYEGIESVVTLDEEKLNAWIKKGLITDGYSLAAYGMYKARQE